MNRVPNVVQPATGLDRRPSARSPEDFFSVLSVLSVVILKTVSESSTTKGSEGTENYYISGAYFGARAQGEKPLFRIQS